MPAVKKGEYFYALGSLAGHKNFKWIREVARRNPDKTFVVAGGKDLRAFGDDTEAKDTHNVFYPGYVSDAENAALMKHCRLFLHPAVFEGFGIPPLEALALGAPSPWPKPAACRNFTVIQPLLRPLRLRGRPGRFGPPGPSPRRTKSWPNTAGTKPLPSGWKRSKSTHSSKNCNLIPTLERNLANACSNRCPYGCCRAGTGAGPGQSGAPPCTASVILAGRLACGWPPGCLPCVPTIARG